MATKRYKATAKPSGVLGSSKVTGRCKRATGTTGQHSPTLVPHASIPNVTLERCEGCGKVLRWLPA